MEQLSIPSLRITRAIFWVGTYREWLEQVGPRNRTVHPLPLLTPITKHPSATTRSSPSIRIRKGRIWIGTFGGGLNLYHPETDSFTYYLEKDGLPNGVVYGILEDAHGDLWMSTNFGISRFNPETETFRNFDEGDGLQSNEFNSSAYAKGRNGEFYFGGINGLTVFQSVEYQRQSLRSPGDTYLAHPG